jgi:hypothetical protein
MEYSPSLGRAKPGYLRPVAHKKVEPTREMGSTFLLCMVAGDGIEPPTRGFSTVDATKRMAPGRDVIGLA